ncbi:MAG: APC family permease [Solirubrobacteraceae bacterium]
MAGEQQGAQVPESRLRRLLVGPPLTSRAFGQTLLSKRLALPIFASDALSSVAYATEAAMLVLIAASLAAREVVLPIALAVAVLLFVVAVSYQQMVHAYSTSGGAYVVARDNLGDLAGLLAGSALLVDYVLTVAVSVSAGVLAITSAVTSLSSARIELAIGFVALLTLVNLRGVREAGLSFALPAYAFIAAMAVTIAVGLARCATSGCPHATVPDPIPAGAGALSIFLVLKAFSSGASALTGIEAIANGVNAFREPQAKNAAQTLGVLAALAISLFLGVSYLAVHVHAAPSAKVSVVSEIARAVFPPSSWSGFLFYVVQGATFAILILAANASYQGFPRLLATLAHDRFAPRQFRHVGNRLAHSNGILILALLAIALIVGFEANVNSLVHLYVVGVFIAFTLSQTGMVRYWHRHHERRWRRRAALNLVGATLTGLVAAIVVVTKFGEGAWAVIVTIPGLIVGLYLVHRHYVRAGGRLQAALQAVRAAGPPSNGVVLYTERFDEATRYAAWYAGCISDGRYHPVAIPDPGHPLDFDQDWRRLTGGSPEIEVLECPDTRTEAVYQYALRFPHGEADFVTVVVPEQFSRRSLVSEFTQGTELAIKLRLLDETGIAIADATRLSASSSGPERLPHRLACRVLVSAVHAASARALLYARKLGIEDTRAVFFAFDDKRREKMRRAWERFDPELPLETVDAPSREFAEALLEYLHDLTADPDTAVAVVMPELRIHGPARILHNQAALYIKRLLLFEPRVILTSVPYRLD